MCRGRPGEDIRPVAVELLIDVGYAILPHPVLPFRRGERVGQHLPVPVKGRQLAALLLNRHPAKQVFHTCIIIKRRIFIGVHHTILVKINPSLLVDGVLSIRSITAFTLSGKRLYTGKEQCHA